MAEYSDCLYSRVESKVAEVEMMHVAIINLFWRSGLPPGLGFCSFGEFCDSRVFIRSTLDVTSTADAGYPDVGGRLCLPNSIY